MNYTPDLVKSGVRFDGGGALKQGNAMNIKDNITNALKVGYC